MPHSPRFSTSSSPRVRSTQRLASERLLETLRRSPATLPEEPRGPLSVDEVLTYGAAAVVALVSALSAPPARGALTAGRALPGRLRR